MIASMLNDRVFVYAYAYAYANIALQSSLFLRMVNNLIYWIDNFLSRPPYITYLK